MCSLHCFSAHRSNVTPPRWPSNSTKEGHSPPCCTLPQQGLEPRLQSQWSASLSLFGCSCAQSGVCSSDPALKAGEAVECALCIPLWGRISTVTMQYVCSYHKVALNVPTIGIEVCVIAVLTDLQNEEAAGGRECQGGQAANHLLRWLWGILLLAGGGGGIPSRKLRHEQVSPTDTASLHSLMLLVLLKQCILGLGF